MSGQDVLTFYLVGCVLTGIPCALGVFARQLGSRRASAWTVFWPVLVTVSAFVGLVEEVFKLLDGED